MKAVPKLNKKGTCLFISPRNLVLFYSQNDIFVAYRLPSTDYYLALVDVMSINMLESGGLVVNPHNSSHNSFFNVTLHLKHLIHLF